MAVIAVAASSVDRYLIGFPLVGRIVLSPSLQRARIESVNRRNAQAYFVDFEAAARV
jgi:hypothetical protein